MPGKGDTVYVVDRNKEIVIDASNSDEWNVINGFDAIRMVYPESVLVINVPSGRAVLDISLGYNKITVESPTLDENGTPTHLFCASGRAPSPYAFEDTTFIVCIPLKKE